MGDGNKSSLRIDWFDGTLIEEARPNTSTTSAFDDEEQPEPKPEPKPQFTEKKPIGFKRLLDISTLQPPILNLEVSHRPGFWNLLDEEELKGDFIVLIVRVLANVYKTLEPNESSKIVKLLRTRFQNSNFLVNIKNYLDELPSVRIVEKRLNSLLWDDPEAFYFTVLDLCEGIINFERENLEFIKDILDLLEITEVSVFGVREEHTERFSNELFVKIEQLKNKAMKLLKDEDFEEEEDNEEIPQPAITNPDKNYFKNLNIFPTKDDLLSANTIPIKPNIINGAYPTVEDYLDIQFKLLREDCFGPLREGICKYLDNPSKRRHENIRVFPKVRIIRNYVSNNRVGHLVDIAWKERSINGTVDSKRYAYNKQLMFGSLLLFTSDNFETILCATVLDSNMALLKDGYVAVSFQNPTSKSIFSESFLMVESEVFFEPYHRVLKVLQESRLDDLPMKRYIVDVQTETRPPAYLSPETIYTVPYDTEDLPYPVLDTNQWPDPVFKLDDSQLEAYKFALTREFAVIQGPPGTGKTYIGIKIAATILGNLSLEGTPMLIICYTNHTLDQFLEGILGITNSIVRLGSQSKSPLLEYYTLHNLRSKIKCKYSYLYASKRNELEKIFKEMTDLQSEIEKCEKEIVSYKNLKPYLKIGDKSYDLRSTVEDSVLNWLFGYFEGESQTAKIVEIDKEVDVEDWEKLDDLALREEVSSCFSENWALTEIDSMLNSIRYVNDVTDNHLEANQMTEKFKTEIRRISKRLECFKKYRTLQNNNKEEYKLTEVKDLYTLNQEQRWQLYYTAVGALKNELLSKMNVLLEQHNTSSQELNEVSTLIDGEVMRTVRVVGVTTTTAARRHDLMRKLHSPIVIVEEAAEVLEAHIVASLTHQCQHLILIGDHKQLRPTAAHYKLAKDYNLEISLFERMIRNGIHARTLATQRRMSRNFVELIVPAIYDKLDTHCSVDSYPDVRGMKDNLYFFSHDVFEDSEGMEDSWSHRNTYEAKWCIALVQYFIKMDYTQDEITILATYNGQVNLLRDLAKQDDSLRHVRITAVDNYQGEENRIVILSLVRSNRDSKIGFLTAPNRICVALSRAKEGFYIFGNMNVLKSASSIWRQINDKLLQQKAIGRRLTVICEEHNENTIDIENVEELNTCLSGTCLRICNKK